MTEVDRGGSATPRLAPTPPIAAAVFGAGLPAAEKYAELLAGHGVERGLIGPREVERLWERHLLNSAVIGERIPGAARTVDLGSGAGLPGIPLLIARPDLDVTLLEPMARRVDWLEYVIMTLAPHATVVRGRAEEPAIQRVLGGADVVTARAVAPLAKLCGWGLPLLREGGVLIAMKGATAVAEVARDREVIRRVGGGEPRIETCGAEVVGDDARATVVIVERVDLTAEGVRTFRKRRNR